MATPHPWRKPLPVSGRGRRASLDDPAVWAFLERRRVAHLATASAAGEPHVVPFCFALIDRTIYSALDQKPKQAGPRELRRVRNLLDNPRMAMVADVYDENWAKLGYVLVHGRGRLVEPNTAEHGQALHRLRHKYPQYQAMALEDRPVIALDPHAVTAWGDLTA